MQRISGKLQTTNKKQNGIENRKNYNKKSIFQHFFNYFFGLANKILTNASENANIIFESSNNKNHLLVSFSVIPSSIKRKCKSFCVNDRNSYSITNSFVFGETNRSLVSFGLHGFVIFLAGLRHTRSNTVVDQSCTLWTSCVTL